MNKVLAIVTGKQQLEFSWNQKKCVDSYCRVTDALMHKLTKRQVVYVLLSLQDLAFKVLS